MTTLRVTVALIALAFSSLALAKGPAGQGRACDAKNQCDAGLTCVGRSGGKSTCELRCASNAQCPEDQRCVKDGAASVCRPINDGLGL